MSDCTWYKGNLHTHTTESDGDADPEFVVNWFMEHGYDFLVLSDHNHRTILEHETKGGPLMIPGEEVSARIEFGSIPIHINGIGISRVVEPIHGDDIIGTIQANVDAIHEANGIAQLNHPNFHWAFDHTHIREVRGAELMEVYNGHPRSDGGLQICTARPTSPARRRSGTVCSAREGSSLARRPTTRTGTTTTIPV